MTSLKPNPLGLIKPTNLSLPSYSYSSSLSNEEAKKSIDTKFLEMLKEHKSHPIAVSAIKTLTYIVSKANATTAQELESQIQNTINYLLENENIHNNQLSIKAACELYKRFISREANYVKSVHSLKKLLVNKGDFFAKHTINARNQICQYCLRFIHNGSRILTHSKSAVIFEVLQYAFKHGNKKFDVIITESSPNKDGHKMALLLKKNKIPATVILDSSVAAIMNKVDFVLVGAEAVVESGGIINKIGTYQMSIIAKAMNKPFYVATESCKFLNYYPITQNDINYKSFEIENENENNNEFDIINDNNNNENNDDDNESDSKSKNDDIMEVINIDSNQVDKQDAVVMKMKDKLWKFEKNRIRDYTSPQYITLIFSDLGILTPSAVSDELIKLYGN